MKSLYFNNDYLHEYRALDIDKSILGRCSCGACYQCCGYQSNQNIIHYEGTGTERHHDPDQAPGCRMKIHINPVTADAFILGLY